ncbi:amidohydrolase family protein [Chthonomonas calidirosea]|uniref:amidohydrolase family protein n=1 Tax=Chthonomonas calidirosea TaxID=454171 RepID=UPI0006EC9A73|nr:amidohydrolase family protein [Chthonomonas calidirosea]CEK14555.1 predicted TIM-barrel fold metal-dependent hydrolase [Chthonomonas calidirosea]
MPDITDVNTIVGPLPSAGADLSVEHLLELMAKHEIGRAFVCSTVGIRLSHQIGNAITRATCLDTPALLPAASLNPTHYFGDEHELHQLKEDGFRLIRFFPFSQGWPVNLASFRALLRALRPLALPLMFQIRRMGDCTLLQSLLNDYPATIILSDVDSSTVAEAIAVLKEQPNWYLETSHLLAPGAVRLVANHVGAERVLFGTAAPQRPIASVLRTLEFAELSTQELELILHRNAERIFSL